MIAAGLDDRWFPALLSLRVGVTALLLVTPLGLWLAFRQAHARGVGRTLVDALILLPLVLPPSVVGLGLILLVGREGPLGRVLEQLFGVRLVFSASGAILASAVVALPLLVKTAQSAFEAVPRELEEVCATLGLPPWARFFRVSLPLAWRGVVAALALGFARAVGEFGATLMVAGNIPGRTNTLPLELYAAFQAGDDARALADAQLLAVAALLVAGVAAFLTRPPARVAPVGEEGR